MFTVPPATQTWPNSISKNGKEIFLSATIPAKFGDSLGIGIMVGPSRFEFTLKIEELGPEDVPLFSEIIGEEFVSTLRLRKSGLTDITSMSIPFAEVDGRVVEMSVGYTKFGGDNPIYLLTLMIIEGSKEDAK